jgi:hypothetical protein
LSIWLLLVVVGVAQTKAVVEVLVALELAQGLVLPQELTTQLPWVLAAHNQTRTAKA